jgi:hypothetical protein
VRIRWGDNWSRHIQPLPAESEEQRVQHGHDAVGAQDAHEFVERSEVRRIQLPDVPGGQVVESDVEALVRCAVARPGRAHVRLHGHQERGVEALGLPIPGVGQHILGRGTKGQCPGGVGDDQRGRAVGVHEAPAAR